VAHKVARRLAASAVAVVTTAALALTGATPASAASATSATAKGTSCKLSAHWTVKFSVNYVRSGSQYRVRWITMSSPGKIKSYGIAAGEPDSEYYPNVVRNYTNPHSPKTVDLGELYTHFDAQFSVDGGNGHCDAFLAAF
jgi:hypothetical protein